jgi:hypothetical protein
VRERADVPFVVPAAPLDSRIGSTRSGSLVRIYVALGLQSATPGARLRLLLLKNDAQYHDADATSAPFGGEGDRAAGQVTLETTLFLDEGEWLEVVTEGAGPPADIRLDPARTLLVAETH